MSHYAKCEVISRQNEKFKMEYLVNKALECKSTKELVLQFLSSFIQFNNRFINTLKSSGQ